MTEKEKEANRVRANLWYKNHPELGKARTRKWQEQNPELRKLQHRAWKIKNRDKTNRANAKRRALKRGAEHSPYTQEQVLATYGLLCHICKSEIDFTASKKVGFGNWQMGLQLDHLIPLSKGGADNLSNMRPAHAVCNLRKNAQLLSAE